MIENQDTLLYKDIKMLKVMQANLKTGFRDGEQGTHMTINKISQCPDLSELTSNLDLTSMLCVLIGAVSRRVMIVLLTLVALMRFP